jgi:pyruvate dehydrogenase E2 component (dihydrolipoamide acetyltransferase)
MAFNFHLPDIGEGVVEGEIVSWKVAEGDRIELDQPMVEVMTDKATVEIPSPRAGTIAKINFQAGEICPVGDILVVIDEGAAAAREHAPAAERAAEPREHAQARAASRPEVPELVPELVPEVVTGAGSGRARVLATPATRRLARQLGVDLARVPPTGKRGRVTSDDVRGFGQTPGHVAPAAVAPASVAVRPGAPAQPIAIARGGDEERIPLRGMRKRIADNMSRSKLTAAHFTYVEEVDMTELVAVRDQARKPAGERGIKLTYLPFIIKAIVSGLKKWPQLNASLDETTQEIVRKKYYHIGMATQGPQGLAVSVLRDADKRSIFGLAQEIERLGAAVREGKASREELTGSTFTITSLGKLGGVLATPIINFPEVGIVGVHKMEQRPAVRDGAIVIRWLMNLSISLDHRLVDGWDGAMFLQDVKGLLEDPTTMFMEMV